MIERSVAVGGTEFTLYDDDERVIATAVLVDGEPEGPFVAALLDWLSHRPGKGTGPPPKVLPFKRRR